MKQPYIECGKVCTAHGVRGQLKVEPWCDSPRVLATRHRVFLAGKDGSFQEIAVRGGQVADRFVLLSLEGINSREEADTYRNLTLYLAREDVPLPKNAVLIADLIGTPVTDADTGRVYGTVADISDGVRTPLITVKTEKGDVLLPDVPQFIVRKDADAGIFVRPIPGFFDDEI